MDNIVDKIQKLISLSKSVNEHEAQEAMLMTQKLLAKHKLSMADVLDAKVTPKNIKREYTDIQFTQATWKSSLADLIAENFGCGCILSRYRVYKISFVGKEDDVQVCRIMFEYAVKVIYSEVKKIQRQRQKMKIPETGVEKSYADGFIYGLSERFEDQKKNNQEWGLVLVVDPEVVKAVDIITSGKQSDFSGRKETRFDPNSYRKGKIDGKNFSISDKISEGEEDESKLLQ